MLNGTVDARNITLTQCPFIRPKTVSVLLQSYQNGLVVNSPELMTLSANTQQFVVGRSSDPSKTAW